MRKYLRYFWTNFHEEATYKADSFFYVGTEVVFFVVFFFIWTNVYAKGGINDISTFSLPATITYYFIASFLYRMNPAGSLYLNRAIWNGELTNEIPKPYSVRLIYIVSAFSLMLFQTLSYLPFVAIIVIFVYKYLIFVSFINLALFIVAMVLASSLGIIIFLLLHSLCFHFGDQDANIGLVGYLISFLGGGLFPLKFLPDGLYNIVSFLPFKYLYDFPVSIYLGKIPESQILSGFIQMILWIFVFFSLYYFSFQSGLKKYAAVGR